MGVVKNTYPPVNLYNRIPFIHDMGHVAEAHGDDLNHLLNLLDKHNMPMSVCVKLIHIHFHLDEGEILAARELDAPPHGKIPFLEPTNPDVAGKVYYGCNYIVDDVGDLQAFEFTTIEGGADLASYPYFVAEFCAFVMERGLQHKFGLSINSGVAASGPWIELDFPEKRATFLLPGRVPLPQSDRLVLRETITKFASPINKKMGAQNLPTHGHLEHSWSTRSTSDGNGEEAIDGVTTKHGLRLTGVPLESGTAFYSVVSAISATT